MVHADGTAFGHVGAQELAEAAIAVRRERARRVRRQAPILAFGIELVRRRAAGGIEGGRLLVGPDLGAAAVGAEREGDGQAARHAELAGAAWHGAELSARRVLQPVVEGHARAIGWGEACYRARLA